MSDLLNNCLTKIKKMFSSNNEEESQSDSRIESARITSNRLQALQRMRSASPTTPEYKLEGAQQRAPKANTGPERRLTKLDDVELDFGMKIGHSTTLP
jgi:hypothetical protein